MPQYKLTYFNLRARAEATRIAFALKKVPYEDVRIEFFSEEWGKVKRDGRFPFETLPILEVDGVTLAQSMTILRFVAKQHGLAPAGDLEVARADMIVDEVYDIENKFVRIYAGEKNNPDKQKASFDDFYNEYLPRHCGYLEKLLKANSDGKGYFVGDQITYADVNFFSMFNAYIARGQLEVPGALKAFPLLSGLYTRVMNEPNIMQWLQKRPESVV